MSKLIDLTGKKFGRLFVIKEYGRDNWKEATWECICDCGTFPVIVRGRQLRSGKSSSCGCYAKQRVSEASLDDLSGKTFGKLLVLKRIENYISPSGNQVTQWLCQCDCGNKKIVVPNSLKKGYTKSCGCLNESKIAYDLKIYFKEKYSAETEYCAFKNPETGYWLRYDIYIPNNIFIEIHGQQHYIKNINWDKTDEEFKYRKKLDDLKKKHAIKNGVYIEIDIRKFSDSIDAILYIEKIFDENKEVLC